MKINKGHLIFMMAALCLAGCNHSPNDKKENADETSRGTDSATVVESAPQLSGKRTQPEELSISLPGKWLKLDRDEQGFFYLEMDPCDSANIRTKSYAITDTSLNEMDVQSATSFSIAEIKKSYFFFDPEVSQRVQVPLFEISLKDQDFYIKVIPIDDLKERHICEFFKFVNGPADGAFEIDYYIPEEYKEMVNHKVVDKCN